MMLNVNSATIPEGVAMYHYVHIHMCLSKTRLPSGVIKHGWLENEPFLSDFPQEKPPFKPGIFECQVWLPEGNSHKIPLNHHFPMVSYGFLWLNPPLFCLEIEAETEPLVKRRKRRVGLLLLDTAESSKVPLTRVLPLRLKRSTVKAFYDHYPLVNQW